MSAGEARAGRRPVSGRVLWLGALLAALACSTLSVQEEKRLGTEAQREVREQFDLLRDLVVVEYVRDLGEELVAAAGPSPFEFRFYVVEDEAINAFAIPGGAIYVHTGTIQKAKDVSELAGVMAHEIAHVTARHVAHLYRRQRNTGVAAQLATILVAILSGNPYITNAANLGTSVLGTAYLSTFTRQAESEADALAVETLIRAGYDPDGMVSFFHTLKKESEGGMQMPQFLSSHPATDERIASVRAMIHRHGALPALKRRDAGKLEIIHQRIELIIGTDPDSH